MAGFAQRPRRILWRAVLRARDESLPDAATSLAYHSVLAVFPGMAVLVALLGLLGSDPRTTDALLGIVSDLGPPSAVQALGGPIRKLTSQDAGAGVALAASSALALFAASGYIGRFTRAANDVFEVREGRPFWRLRPQQLLITLAIVVLLALALVALVIGGPVADAVGRRLGLAGGTVSLYEVVKWPAIAAVLLGVVSLLYGTTPNVRRVRHRFVSPGGAAAVLAWIAGSAGFAAYVANFGSYDKTYGSLAGIVIFLVWIYISNLALLLGLLIDAELERQRELDHGLPGAEEEIQLPERDPPG